MKNWLMSLLTLVASAATIFAPQLQGVVAHHPAIFAGIAGAVGVISHILPSPTGAVLSDGTSDGGSNSNVAGK